MALPQFYSVEKDRNSMAGLSAYENKGKGNPYHAEDGRFDFAPGGKKKSATTTARLARGDAVEEARDKARSLEYELIGTPRSLTEKEYQEKRAAVDKAKESARKLEAENERLTKEEIARGQDKKRKQDTPGKKETLAALVEAKKASEQTRQAYIDMNETKYGPKERDQAEKKYSDAAGKSREARRKLESAISSQMVRDKQFNDDLRQHIEDGLGVKLKDFELKTKDYGANGQEYKLVEAKTMLDKSDLGVFGKFLRRVAVSMSTSMNTDPTLDNFGQMRGRVSLEPIGRYFLSVSYSPDGSYVIRDQRGE